MLEKLPNFISLTLLQISQWSIPTNTGSWHLLYFSITQFIYFCFYQRGPQWRTWGCRAGGAQTPRGDKPSHLSLSPDCRRSLERSLCPAAIHPRLLPHSPGPPGATCTDVPRCNVWPQPVDQLPSPPRAHWSHCAVRLAFPPACQPLWANGCVRGWRVSGRGASPGRSADSDPLSAVAAAAWGLEGGCIKGEVRSIKSNKNNN